MDRNLFVFDYLFNAVTNPLFEIFFNVFANDKDQLIKSSLDGIMNGIIHDDLIVQTNGFQLFDARAKSTAQASRHND